MMRTNQMSESEVLLALRGAEQAGKVFSRFDPATRRMRYYFWADAEDAGD
jgi:hypothetical protein